MEQAGASSLRQYRKAVGIAALRRYLAALSILLALVAGLLAIGGSRLWFALVGLCLLTAIGLLIGTSDPGRWQRGAQGEIMTAQILDCLPRRWLVFHDLAVPASRANVDHLVFGRGACWVIDTKTTRGQLSQGWKRVSLGHHDLDTGPSEWEVERVERVLGIPVNSLICVHHPGSERVLSRSGKKIGSSTVLEARDLERYLKRRRRGVSRASMSSHELSQRVEDQLSRG